MRDQLLYKICIITDQITTEQLIFSRRNRNWEQFDKLTEVEKLLVRLEELEYFVDDIDPNYVPKYF